MIKARSLFLSRLRLHYKHLWETIRSVVDWVVVLYILAPALAIFVAYYRSLWSESPEYLAQLPIEVVLLIVFLSSFLYDLKSFIHNGDQLYLVQNKSVLKRGTILGLFYTTFLVTLFTIVMMVIFLPVFKMGHGFSTVEITGLGGYVLVWNMVFVMVRKVLKINGMSLVYLLLSYSLLLLSYLSLWKIYLNLRLEGMLLVLLFLAILLFVLTYKQAIFRGRKFFSLVAYDVEANHKWTKLLLWQNGHAKLVTFKPTKKYVPFKKPLFKNRSPHNVLTETFIKSVLRDGGMVLTLIQLCVLLTVFLVIVDSVWIGLFLWVFSLFAFVSIAKSLWMYFQSSSYFKMYSWREKDLTLSSKKSILFISVPFMTVITIVLTFVYLSPVWLIVTLGGLVAFGYIYQ
ncbi:ABC transporter permease [Pontibacillus sp. ALD_SL1]|uniref:ABC transporter permease n=1 Tax=Pontibacillus sp. ALD_SL1 TaxID=2777185 RepID=UPI001A95D1DB|nr:ABC transporter permease [Pontibacillus sp. ALD_SL1]QST01152.1 ABC transporter permease [Pontibacillus sp. ALD_SL1]